MRKVRIGNDINVRWEVKTDGQAVSLEGKALKLYVRSAYRKEEITTFTVEGCVVSFTYPASMQRMTGARAVILEDATEGAVYGESDGSILGYGVRCGRRHGV